ncbi:hypothetical protein [Flavobacterium adhaerens]|uniref:hypothetical protein n=1 Tax=Flavobacterium adhaerens TaxID=3149043 RepID=UPI0032B3FE4E
MEIVNDIDFQIYNGRFDFEDAIINIHCLRFFSAHTIEKTNQLKFINCTFNGTIEIQDIKKPSFKLSFNECVFNEDITINDIEFDYIFFIDSKKIKNIHIDGIFNRLRFNNKGIPLNGDIAIWAKIQKELNLDNIFIEKGQLDLNINSFDNLENKNFSSTFKNAKIYEGSFVNSHFGEYANFKNLKIFHKLIFEDCKFVKSNFEFSDFKSTSFNNCKFYSTTLIENSQQLNYAELKFIACRFEKYVLFDNSIFKSFEISHSVFQKKVSFDSFETNMMKLHQVTFAEAAYFDDLNKNNNDVIENWDRKTLRAIKRELVNTHNQIDYLRFKAYELIAYKKEVNQNKLNWKDLLILHFNEDSNYFGLDWTKGIRFIFQWSFIFYVLYIISYSARIDDSNCIPKIEDFLTNYLKFTNPLSFLDTPLVNSEDYFLPLLFTSMSKIFVSYGIYQTIQAFRKFGVNGG